MRIALIADIHGNEIAFDKVLSDIKRRGVDEICCLGDVATLGADPAAVIGVLRDLRCRCVLGNHDEFLFDDDSIARHVKTPIIAEAVAWCRQQLSDEDIRFLRSFQPMQTVEAGPSKELCLFHGSPRSPMDNLLADTPPQDLDRMLDGREAALLAGGHTHIQMLRQHRGALLINPGSVGLPFLEYVNGGQPSILCHAEYAVVEVDSNGAVAVDLRRLPLDRSSLRQRVAASDNPLSGPLVEQYS
jgi:putative phosphoesterase